MEAGGMAMAERNWEIFLRLLCESREAVKDSAIYKAIIKDYPFQFIHKLMSSIVDENLAQRRRESAAVFVLEEMIHVGGGSVSVIERLYARIGAPTLDFLRRSAMDLMIRYQRNSVLQICGQHMAMELVQSWLRTVEPVQEWDRFLEFVEEGLTTPSSAHYLDIFLSIFRWLHPDLRDRLVFRMAPRIAGNRAQFEEAVVQLLLDARDATPFLFLPCIIHVFFDELPLPITLAQGAIMSNLFSDIRSYSNGYMLQIAVILRYCVQHSTPYQFSVIARIRLRTIIGELAYLTNLRAAMKLYRAFIRKYPPRNCRDEVKE